MSLGNGRPKDWSAVAWGEKGAVYVYNKDGTDSQHFAKSAKMKKYGPTDKPAAFDKASLTKIKKPNQKKPAAKVEVPAPDVPLPPPYNPMKKFAEWATPIASAPNAKGFAYDKDSTVIKGVYGAQIYKNVSTPESNKKVVFKQSVLKVDWPVPEGWTHVAGGFDDKNVKVS